MRSLSRFLGGVKLPGQKQMSTQLPVEKAAVPRELVLPMQQHIGKPAEPIVAVGDKVLKGQKIARAVDYISAPIHAPTSGVVIAIEARSVPHPSGMTALCIVIESDGEDRWCELTPHEQDFRNLDPSALRNLVREAGIVGLGGAGFPSYVKLNPGPDRVIETLIINGAECEPYITCDDMLMRERADEVIAGIGIIRHAVQAREVVIAIEDNKPQAREAIEKAIATANVSFDVVSVPTIYPAGGEKQLIHTVTGKVVPANGLPAHVGVVCQNVGTSAAIYRAIMLGEPLISRYVTVAGDVTQPRNLEVLFGTPLKDLISQAGDATDNLRRLIVGGPMMGFAMHSDLVPVIKTSNCLLVDCGKTQVLSESAYVMPCIRCGNCAEVCPVNLLPQQLYWYSRGEEYERLLEFDLFDCIECGCCDYVCPSRIPLVQYFRFAKAEVWHREGERKKSDIARQRHEFRQLRLEREKLERSAKHKKRMAALKTDEPKAEQEKTAEDPKKAAILAAMERVKAKKAAQSVMPKNTENLTDAQQRQIAEAEQRRTQAESEKD
ncbi:MAG: electron transport complex subunit RsxC [Gammaproteobacteria bacterium]|nr:electron transport complex subunit RsxC [Gammaproteobacteria bacterium]